MSALTRRKKRKLKNEINVVPYIDVMLVLLIIFMVTAPLLNLGVDIELPQSNAKPIEQNKDPVIVSINSRGEYSLKLRDADEEFLDRDLLARKIAAFIRANPQTPVYIAADQRLPYQNVMEAMVLLQGAGVPKVGLMSQPNGNP